MPGLLSSSPSSGRGRGAGGGDGAPGRAVAMHRRRRRAPGPARERRARAPPRARLARPRGSAARRAQRRAVSCAQPATRASSWRGCRERAARGPPQDVAHDALDGTLHRRQPIERGRSRAPRAAQRGGPARGPERIGDRPVEATAAATQYRSRSSGRMPGGAWRGVPRGARRLLDREQTIGVDGSASPSEDSTARAARRAAVGRGGRRWRARWRGARPARRASHVGAGGGSAGRIDGAPTYSAPRNSSSRCRIADEGEHRALAGGRHAPPEIARRDGRDPRALDEQPFRLALVGSYRTAAITSWTAASRSGSSVSGAAMAARQASRGDTPLAISRAAATSRRVLGTSARPRSRSCGGGPRAPRARSRWRGRRRPRGRRCDLELGRREVELERDEALPRARSSGP